MDVRTEEIRTRVEKQPCSEWNKLHVMTLLTDVAQLLDGWHQDGTAWSEWDEEVRRRVSNYLQQVNTTPSEQFETSVTALREEVERLKGAQAKQRANMVLQVRVLLQAAAENWDNDERECARINDEKARFLLMYLPDFKPEEFNAEFAAIRAAADASVRRDTTFMAALKVGKATYVCSVCHVEFKTQEELTIHHRQEAEAQ